MPLEKTPDKIYSVSELNTLSQGVLESSVGEVWVRGEVSGLKTQASGHVYFSLKDDKSVLSVALFKGSAVKTNVKLAEGKQILVFGEVGIYLPRGSYQMVAKFLLDEGAGKLQQEFERLKKQLEGEGLFAKERKVEIPRLPRTVAFITSPTGAVWQDFTQILKRRDWRGRVILFPCRVQGAEAPGEIVECLRRADRVTAGDISPSENRSAGASKNSLENSQEKEEEGLLLFSWAKGNKADIESLAKANTDEKNKNTLGEVCGEISQNKNFTIDLIVVGRGGGSIEDLWAFNDERVVRAVAAVRTPIISAVGHETDFTLCDFAADFRAETPSAAAELIAGHFNDARTDVESLWARVMMSVRRGVLTALQQVRDLSARLVGRSPRVVLDRAAQRLDETDERMARALEHRLSQSRGRLSTLSAQLNGLNPEITLRRGYAMVSDAEGKLITRAGMAKEGQEVEVRWADGKRGAKLS